MRRLQSRASPFDQAVDVGAWQLDRRHIEGLLTAPTPDGDLDGLLVGGRALHFAKPRDDVAVDREHEIALLEHSRRG